jgi:SNF2 family DNA or RNA helicase
MQLRKVSNHPLLLRVYYTDVMIRQIAEILLNTEPQYKREGADEIAMEFAAASDWELHEVCEQRVQTLPMLAPFLLSDAQVFEISGKMAKLKEVLASLKAEGHRVLLFSQMTKMMNILGTTLLPDVLLLLCFFYVFFFFGKVVWPSSDF